MIENRLKLTRLLDEYSPSGLRYALFQCSYCNQEVKRLFNNVNFITFNNETKSLSDWADAFNIPYRTLYARIEDFGWSVERALTTPVRKAKKC